MVTVLPTTRITTATSRTRRPNRSSMTRPSPSRRTAPTRAAIDWRATSSGNVAIAIQRSL
jgi:hypothetical protein